MALLLTAVNLSLLSSAASPYNISTLTTTRFPMEGCVRASQPPTHRALK